MREEVIGMLINGDKDALCSSFELLPFQADILEFYYKNINSMHNRNLLVNQILTRYYSSDELKNSMAKSYIQKTILFSKDNGKSFLMSKCGLSDEESSTFIKEYLQYNKGVDEMLSAELDVSNTNILMNEMINKILPIFLESQTQKKL